MPFDRDSFSKDPADIEKGMHEPKRGMVVKNPKKVKEVIQKLEAKCHQVLGYRQQLANLIFRLLEIHSDKIVAYAIVHVALKEVIIDLNTYL
ncbi:hypothetical protein L596_027990 [Steinernema carpocapsae]|uniref:Uncharacterized protein n=1 Tax=Steinernema carpocapsae TaxID=34508 RepID=A0A4U5LX74_STECR|nr:hypothetical protein L596_027990 [Steinernema carpocapsae]